MTATSNQKTCRVCKLPLEEVELDDGVALLCLSCGTRIDHRDGKYEAVGIDGLGTNTNSKKPPTSHRQDSYTDATLRKKSRKKSPIQQRSQQNLWQIFMPFNQLHRQNSILGILFTVLLLIIVYVGRNYESLQDAWNISSNTSVASDSSKDVQQRFAGQPQSSIDLPWIIENFWISSDGNELITITQNASLQIYSMDTDYELTNDTSYANVANSVEQLAISGNSQFIAIYENDSINVFELNEGSREFFAELSLTARILDIEFMEGSNTILYMDIFSTVYTWSISESIASSTRLDIDLRYDAAVLSATGNQVAIVGSLETNYVVEVWDTADNIVQYEYEAMTRPQAISFSPNGRYISISDQNHIVLVDLTYGVEILNIENNARRFPPSTFSNDSQYFAFISSIFNDISVVDLESGKLLDTVIRTDASTMNFSPDKSSLVVLNTDKKTLEVWSIK